MTIPPSSVRDWISASRESASSPVPPGPRPNPRPFTIDDYFQVATIRVDDWTKDGRWLACALSVQGRPPSRGQFPLGRPDVHRAVRGRP